MSRVSLERDITESDKGQRILIVAPGWLGDAVMSLPMLGRLKNNLPLAEIEILAKSRVAGIYENLPIVRSIIEYSGRHNVKDIVSLVRKIREKRYAAAFILPNSFFSALLPFLARIPLRFGYSADLRGALLTRSLPRADEAKSRHMTTYYAALLSLMDLNGAPPLDRPRLIISEERMSKAVSIFRKCGIFSDNSMLIGINPGASNQKIKVWPPDRFALLADMLVSKIGARPIFFGAERDAVYIDNIMEKMRGKAFSLAGRTPVSLLPAAIKLCNLFISNDTGPMHIADAVDTPLIAIFGPTDPAISGPSGGKSVIVRLDLPCSPCNRKGECPYDVRCMHEITPEMVLEKVLKLLETSSHGTE